MMNMNANSKRTAFFLMGGPASGKTTVRKNRLPDVKVLDCDMFKEFHPDYDPKNILPEVHAWSNVQCSKAFFAACGGNEDFVYDSTGTQAEKMVSMMNTARSANFEIVLIYVPCTLDIALARNAKRARTVPEAILVDKYATISTSFEIISRYADKVEVVR